jgi:hypothetical protein
MWLLGTNKHPATGVKSDIKYKSIVSGSTGAHTDCV